MSNAAHPIAIKAVQAPVPMTSLDDAPLELPTNGTPVAVTVSYDSAIDKVVFSLGTLSSTSLAWQTKGYALIVNFVFDGPNVKEFSAITPSCWFTDTFLDESTGQLRQSFCVPPVPGEYHFAAEVVTDVATGAVMRKVDPVIVVTPIISS